MPTPHSSVIYVEPNIEVGYNSDESKTWRVKDNYDRAPRLEDYCIAMNIEVEICSRDKVNESTQSVSEVLILQYRNTDNVGYVNFMGGTKIGGWTFENDNNGIRRKPRLNYTPDALTTYYADMYVGDLIDYGTTEMIGIKSVTIDFERNCVPIINITFTDVRGLSLFQPTELSRNNSYESIKGINSDNVAQSFFQCFFKMPLPKFTIYIKGFYGEPVAYEVMCDKFETKFNSDTGDFDVNAKFIGYSYSFMTDVSLDALLAAPYSDYLGKDYWEQEKQSERFVLPNKNGLGTVEMPTIVEIAELFMTSNPESTARNMVTPLTEEEETHTSELARLNELRDKSRSWYESLYSIVCTRFGKERCFDFITSGEHGEYYRILILADKSAPTNLSGEYTQFPDEFKKLNLDLFNMVNEFNNDVSSFKKIINVSIDFSTYSRIPLFDGCEIKRDGSISLIGFSKDCPLDLTELRNRLFNYKELDANGIEPNTNISERTLKVIYHNGKDQLVDAYLIDFDYLPINKRINALNADADRSLDDKEREASRRAYNEAMISALGWYPSIENFTKIMMAHLETFMYMMYKNASEIINEKRTAESLGVSVGEDGNITDTNKNSEYIPPFPRVTRTVVDDDITRQEDEWVGSFVNGTGFKEVDLVDGLFNGIDEVQSIIAASQTVAKEQEIRAREEQMGGRSYVIDYPLTPYDFFLNTTPYGNSNEDLNNINALVGRIAIRMFNILALGGIQWDKSSEMITQIAWCEASNCYRAFNFEGNKLRKILGTSADSSDLNAEKALELVTSAESKPIMSGDAIPWKNADANAYLLNPKDQWLERYKYTFSDGKYGFMYPVHGGSFSGFDTTLAQIKKGSGYRNDNSVNISYVNENTCYSYLKGDLGTNESVFNNIFITEDYKVIADHLEHASSIADARNDNRYKKISEFIASSSVNHYQSFLEGFISINGVFKSKLGVEMNKTTQIKKISSSDENLFYESDGKHYYEGKGDYSTEAETGVFNNSFISEAKGFKKDSKGNYEIDDKKSLFARVKDDVGTYYSLADKSAENKMAVFVMSLDCIDYSALSKYMIGGTRFQYMPKLAVLQFGAALYKMMHYKIPFTSLPKRLVLSNSFKEYAGDIIGTLSPMARIGFVNYFFKWAKANVNEIDGNLTIKVRDEGVYVSNANYSSYFTVDERMTRALFNEKSPYIQRLTNDLMKLTLVVKGAVNYTANATRYGHTIDRSVAEVYLDQFFNRLRELYGLKQEDTMDENGIIKLAKTPSKTTVDMRKELYRYLKLLYDKWIPTTPLSTWKFESFFLQSEDEKIKKVDGGGGHMFHFIDSYYNKIGDKLLINPKKLTDKIVNALNATDINTMMLGFMADIYSQNKCMLICVQNFLDLSDRTSISKMFTPLAYNDMKLPNKHPDFVVVYPYEPSKNLNVNNSEFKDDSFMLNDENLTPMAIKSRGGETGRWYKIPAFGVSYGKQYQSFFKKIDINMTSPIATQQSIAAKHSILRQAQNATEKSVVAQDIYDIYSTQSYMCTVEMMGCAWIQPLMYFVLTNVPMFRGSYMIMKVRHSISPGNMVTQFTGCRMANAANKLIEDIFTDDTDIEGQVNYLEEMRENNANVDNDCHYKVFPVLGSSVEVKPNATASEKAMATMRILTSHGFTEQAAAGVCGNIHVESAGFTTDAKGTADNKGSYGLCQWHSSRLTMLKKLYGSRPSFSQQVEFVLYELGIITGKDGKKCPYTEYFKCSSAQTLTNVEKVARDFCNCFEHPKEGLEHFDKRIKLANDYYKMYTGGGASTQSSQPSKDANGDGLYNSFFLAVQQTSYSSNQINVKLKQGFVNITRDGKKTKIMTISREGGNDNLGMIFDVILNEREYYQYVKELWWVYPTGGGKSNPLHIDVILSNSVNPAQRKVYFAETKKTDFASLVTYGSDSSCINEVFLRSIYKKYRGVNSEIPQFPNAEIFKDMKVQDCDEIIAEKGKSHSGNNSSWIKSVQTMGKWYESNVHTYSKNVSKGIQCSILGGYPVRDDCSGFVTACLQYFGALKKGYPAKSSNDFVSNSDLANTLSSKGFRKMNYSWDTVEPYDIIAYNGHVEILAEKGETPKSWGWGNVHDCKNGHACMPANTGNKPKGSTYKTIWRFIG